MRRLICLLTAVLLLLCTVPGASAEAAEPVEPYVQRMISYYRYYQEEAEQEIDTLLGHIKSLDPGQGILWEKIMDSWSWVNSEMEVELGVLPDGLPEDDSLCIVVLGYGLNDDGSMKRELVRRLEVALASAEKYPNAYVLCTGGETSDKEGVSEAGQMGKWLRNAGLSKSRLILETRSYSTTQNAQRSYALLAENYPQVDSIALVTSDYHMRWGCALFAVMRHWEVTHGSRELVLVGNAAYDTGNPDYDSIYAQAQGISQIAGIPMDTNGAPGMEPDVVLQIPAQPEEIENTVPAPAFAEPETMAAEEQEPAAPEPVRPMWIPIALAAAVLLVFLPVGNRKEKNRNGSN